MTIYLALEDHRLGDTPLTASSGIGWMVLAIVVDCVALLLTKSAVLALLILVVRLCTLASHVADELIEGLVLTIGNHTGKLVDAVRAFLVWTVVTLRLRGSN